MKLKRLIAGSLISVSLLVATAATQAAEYTIDSKGMHAAINFRIKHLGYSWLHGRFNSFDGTFSYDPEKPSEAKVMVNIDPSSIDSNHAERDKHLRNDDFLDVEKFPEAKFVSTSYKPAGDGTGVLEGELTLKGVTNPISIDVTEIGGGKDPWGGYRYGFDGTTKFALADFGIDYNLGPASREVELTLSIEGIRN